MISLEKRTLLIFSLIALLLCNNQLYGQDYKQGTYFHFLTPATEINKSRALAVTGVQLAGFTTALILLDKAWYQDFRREQFHFHNDLPDWKQMDKFGHITAAYHLSRISAQSFRWAGINNNNSALYGAVAGTSFLAVVEVFDGFSTGWGFSIADFTANKVGAISFLSQQLAWQEQKILWKYSFSSSGLAQHRPEVLGDGITQTFIKDYNGMTFWLSANLHSLSGEMKIFPPWLNLALGYGATGMLGSRENPVIIDGMQLPHLDRHRQWYLAPDIDWQRIPTNSPLLSTIFSTLNVIKFPTPAIEYNRIDGVVFHLLFF